MKKSEKILSKLIKDKLVEMTINGELPSDMNELDMDSIIDECVDSTEYIEAVLCERASKVLSYNPSNTLSIVHELQRIQDEEDGSLSPSDYDIVVWEPLENCSVSEILDLIE